MRTEDLATLMAANAISPDAQLRQTRVRVRLVDEWQIAEGARVLEIGCGQGDTTAVLADAVGRRGRVVAVDRADASYGAPVSLGDSARRLAQGPLGDRIEFRFGFDALDPANAFPDDAFDAVVLAHCTWYFDSLVQLAETFRRIRPWAARLCLSEWDLEPRTADQAGHFLAVMIQAQIEAHKTRSEANVRTPYSREALRTILRATRWEVASETLVDASELDDARWEIASCLSDSLPEAEVLELGARLQTLLASQVDVLRRISERGESRPLPSYSVVATRSADV
jgi:SAM-dependent methyltransferase